MPAGPIRPPGADSFHQFYPFGKHYPPRVLSSHPVFELVFHRHPEGRIGYQPVEQIFFFRKRFALQLEAAFGYDVMEYAALEFDMRRAVVPRASEKRICPAGRTDTLAQRVIFCL